MQGGLGDPEVFRDLVERGFAFAGDRDHIAATSRRRSSGNGFDIAASSTEKSDLHGSDVNQTGAGPKDKPSDIRNV